MTYIDWSGREQEDPEREAMRERPPRHRFVPGRDALSRGRHSR